MSLAHPLPEPGRSRHEDTLRSLTPPMVPRLREYRVVPMQEHRRVLQLRAAFYVLCFVVGIATGLMAARMLGTHDSAARGDQPLVTVRTLQ